MPGLVWYLNEELTEITDLSVEATVNDSIGTMTDAERAIAIEKEAMENKTVMQVIKCMDKKHYSSSLHRD